MFSHLWHWKVSAVILTAGIDSQKILLFFCIFLIKVNCGCPSNCSTFYTLCLQYEAHRKLFAVLTFPEFKNAWIKVKHQMKCTNLLVQKSKSVIWITVTFANWSTNCQFQISFQISFQCWGWSIIRKSPLEQASSTREGVKWKGVSFCYLWHYLKSSLGILGLSTREYNEVDPEYHLHVLKIV